jgi:UDP-glucose 4-epimerase
LSDNKNFSFIKGDLLDTRDIKDALVDVSKVYHLAANPDVRFSETNTKTCFEQNILASYNLFETVRKNNVNDITFISTCAVYGDAKLLPTPESYQTVPISVYGASKLAAEGLLCSFCHTFGMKSVIFRLANIIGNGSNHGVIYDFINKLKMNSEELEILGNGKQSKSYLYIDDCIDGILFAEGKSKSKTEIFNLGSKDMIDVKTIADIVVKVLGLKNVRYVFSNKFNGRGWKSDMKLMQLSIDKIKKLGWKPEYNSKQAVEKTVKELARV